MRLRLLTALGTTALALSVPSAALAHHGRGHHHHHHHHHAKFRVLNIGAGNPTPTAPTSPSEENAGTVVSYEKEVLTLTLKDGSTVSGKVTANTHVKCFSPRATSEGTGDDKGSGDEQWGGWDHKDRGDDGRWWHDSTPEPPCDTSALVKGAVVHSAQLRIGASGSEFECIVVVRPSS